MATSDRHAMATEWATELHKAMEAAYGGDEERVKRVWRVLFKFGLNGEALADLNEVFHELYDEWFFIRLLQSADGDPEAIDKLIEVAHNANVRLVPDDAKELQQTLEDRAPLPWPLISAVLAAYTPYAFGRVAQRKDSQCTYGCHLVVLYARRRHGNLWRG
jgi:hypothetical protein